VERYARGVTANVDIQPASVTQLADKRAHFNWRIARAEWLSPDTDMVVNSLSKFTRPSQFLLRNFSTCIRAGPSLVVPTACVPFRSGFGNVRHYANPPGGGIPGGGFPGFSLGQQQQKGDALKEYVRFFNLFKSKNNLMHIFTAECGFNGIGEGRKTGSNYWKR
jgi:hypothetical protein